MNAPHSHNANADQVAYWNGPAGQRWADRQAAQDVLLKPVADLVVDRARLAPGERVIDAGCGSGATAIAFARKVAPSGHVLGIDVSGPMLERARHAAPKDLPIDFVLADATVYPFEPKSFDVLASRFGVMFFADPALSFANMRKALKPSGRMAFACWREPRENPFFMAPLQAAYKHVPKLPQLGPEDPGPFAFASEARVRRILDEAGFAGVEMEACPLLLDAAIGRGLDGAVQGALEIGPVSRALEGQPEDARAAVAASIREALMPFAKDDAVLLPASVWIVTARAS
ncbi:class I SAM-dependent methyltransferase [Bradyrhizobium icense]|uniref:Methyltransferase n=1 Tax=Bradyrhizobium icense TaxID=1274631 RepID=A0A1B1UGK7_9BRAD|nr:methyltransferase domain-containing protein [Bradyrhizobium icense]ANW01889.1 methyltransferase [Bradyrhizobium icense]